MVIVAHLHRYTKTQQIIQFRRVIIMAYELVKEKATATDSQIKRKDKPTLKSYMVRRNTNVKLPSQEGL